MDEDRKRYKKDGSTEKIREIEGKEIFKKQETVPDIELCKVFRLNDTTLQKQSLDLTPRK